MSLNRFIGASAVGQAARAIWETQESVELATLEWLAWFNHYRLQEPIGYIPPAEAKANKPATPQSTTTVAA